MKTLETNLASAAPDVATEPGPPEPRHGVPLRRIVWILAVLIVVGAVAGFIPRLRQRNEAQGDIAAFAATTVTLVSPNRARRAMVSCFPPKCCRCFRRPFSPASAAT
jgi:hypothetical protein